MGLEFLGNRAKGSSVRSMCNTWLTVEKHLVYLAQSWLKQRFPFATSAFEELNHLDVESIF